MRATTTTGNSLDTDITTESNTNHSSIDYQSLNKDLAYVLSKYDIGKHSNVPDLAIAKIIVSILIEYIDDNNK